MWTPATRGSIRYGGRLNRDCFWLTDELPEACSSRAAPPRVEQGCPCSRFLPVRTIPDLESTMKAHTFTVATAAAAFLAASTMASFGQTGTGGGTGTGTKSTTTTTSTTAPSNTAPSTTAPTTTSTTAQKTKPVDCPGHAERSQGMAKKKNPNCK